MAMTGVKNAMRAARPAQTPNPGSFPLLPAALRISHEMRTDAEQRFFGLDPFGKLQYALGRSGFLHFRIDPGDRPERPF